jgi:hypothetical protein
LTSTLTPHKPSLAACKSRPSVGEIAKLFLAYAKTICCFFTLIMK